jgi:transcriptional regulator with XRE-family HTH domain
MPRPKPTAEDLKERKTRAREWKTFRRNFKITQRALADLMAEPGEEGAGCRRTIQMIESGKISPHKATLTRFAIVKNRIETENA